MPTFRESVAAGARIMGADRNTDPIEIVEYDPAWPTRYEEMRARLAQALGATALRIDHVGSTAVPGLAAKPIIDITMLVADVNDEAAWIPDLEAVGYVVRIRESEPECCQHRRPDLGATPGAHRRITGRRVWHQSRSSAGRNRPRLPSDR